MHSYRTPFNNGAEHMSKDPELTLKQYLLALPKQYDFRCTTQVREHIRRALYLSLSDDGRFLSHLFDSSLTDQSGLFQDSFDWTANDKSFHGHPNRPCSRSLKKGEPCYRCLTCGFDETCALCSYCFDSQDHENHTVHVSIVQREHGGVCDCGDPEAWTRGIHCGLNQPESAKISAVPDEFLESISHTLNVVLDYIVDVMSCSTLLLHDAPDDLMAHSKASSLLKKVYGGEDVNSNSYMLIAYNDPQRQFRDAVQRIRLATGKVTQFAHMVASRIEDHGRANVVGSTNLESLKRKQLVLNATGMASCIRSYRDVFREEMCDEMIHWLTDFCSSPLFSQVNSVRDEVCKAFLSKWNSGVSHSCSSTYSVGHLQSYFIPTKPDHRGEVFGWTAEKTETPPFIGSRLQYFLFFDIRFWKSARSLLHELYISALISNLSYKREVCCQYVDLYPAIAEMFLLLDREPECGLMGSLSAQIFTTPSNALAIVERGDLVRFLATTYSYLTQGKVSVDDESADLAFKSLKNRKWGQVLFDLSYIISRNQKSELVFDTQFISSVLDFLQLFQGRPTITRAASVHVEYESNDYGMYFNSISVVCNFAETIAKCASRLSQDRASVLNSTIEKAIDRIATFKTHMQGLSPSQDCDILVPEPSHKQIAIGSITTTVEEFSVGSSKVSLLHPLHSFLAMLLQLDPSFNDPFQLALASQNWPSSTYEYPLRTMVLLAQIKTGFWIRNGFSVRTQMHIYRNTGVREFGYMNDLYLLQCFAASHEPELVVSTILERWDLIPWTEGDFANFSMYEPSILPYMVEECLCFFIQMLSETSHLFKRSEEEITELRIRQEIIHTLCFKPISFSTLLNEMPEHISAEKKLEAVLQSVADYHPPKTCNDTGIYKLKSHVYRELNPYYAHYTSNKREEAIKCVKETLAKKKGKSLQEVYIRPSVASLDHTAHSELYGFVESRIFVLFLNNTLKHVEQEGVAKSESMLDLVLHLVHICSLTPSADKMISAVFHENQSMGSTLYRMLSQDQFKGYHSKIRSILRNCPTVDSVVPEFSASVIEESGDPQGEESALERKKKHALLRQKKIMAKFKRQQEEFASKQDDLEMTMDKLEDDDKAGDPHAWMYPEEHCILCQTPSDDVFGVISYVSKSAVFGTVSTDSCSSFCEAFRGSVSLDEEVSGNASSQEEVIGPGLPPSFSSQHVATSCGHGMHFSCYMEYLDASKSRHAQITRSVPEDADRREFVCPLCKSINNVFLPILASSNNKSLEEALTRTTLGSHPQLAEQVFENCRENWKPEYKDHIFIKASMQPSNKSELPEICLEELFDSLEKVALPYSVNPAQALLSNSIKALEISLRGVGHDLSSNWLVTGQLSNQALTNLRCWDHVQDIVVASQAFSEIMKTSAPMSHFNEDVSMSNRLTSSFLAIADTEHREGVQGTDYFSVLVGLPCTDNANFPMMIHYCLEKHIYQTLHSLAYHLSRLSFSGQDEKLLSDIPCIDGLNEAVTDQLYQLFQQIFTSWKTPVNCPNGKILYAMLIKLITPFLRNCAILAHVKHANDSGVNYDFVDKYTLEADRLCAFLRMPQLETYIDALANNDDFVKPFVLSTPHLEFSQLAYPNVVSLIKLPSRLDYFFTKIYYTLDERPRDPAICMFCAALLDLQSQDVESSYGECTAHCQGECFYEVGIFLIPKSCTILLLYRGYGSFHHIPYLDPHGELAEESKLGQPLYLDEKRYQLFIRTLWLQHNMPNYITRRIESTVDIGGWETM